MDILYISKRDYPTKNDVQSFYSKDTIVGDDKYFWKLRVWRFENVTSINRTRKKG